MLDHATTTNLIDLGCGHIEGATGNPQQAALAAPHIQQAIERYFSTAPTIEQLSEHPQVMNRLGVVIAAMGLRVDPEWREGLYEHFRARRDFMVHAYLQSIAPTAGRKLRRVYGAQRRALSFKRCEELAMPVAEIERLIKRGHIVWIAPHFQPDELMCEGTETLFFQPWWAYAVEALRQDVRTLDETGEYGEQGQPDPDAVLDVTSFWRHRDYNKDVPGAAHKSPHTKAEAIDISMVGHNAERVIRLARGRGLTGLLEYSNRCFAHFDTTGRHLIMDGAFPRSGRVYATKRPEVRARKQGDGLAAAAVVGTTAVAIGEKVSHLENIKTEISRAEDALATAEQGAAMIDRAGSMLPTIALYALGAGLAAYIAYTRYKRFRLFLTRAKEWWRAKLSTPG